MNDIQFYNRSTGKIEIEKVYGDKYVKWLYMNPVGKGVLNFLTRKAFSSFYGILQEHPYSAKKVDKFIDEFRIDMDDYDDGGGFKSFNDFFIRKFRAGKRSFESTPGKMPAFSEARYLGWDSVNDEQTFPVKGHHLSAKGLLQCEKWSSHFQNGPLLIARLCPIDYHRYHFPDSGKVLDNYPIHGSLHSVNPLALKFKSDIFITNEREVTILETENFGKLAYIEVGAICVGKIIKSHDHKSQFLRGEEKGYFLFGGSTIVLLGEKGKWKPSSDVLENTNKKLETWVPLGQEIATKI